MTPTPKNAPKNERTETKMKRLGMVKGWMGRLGVAAALGVITVGGSAACGSQRDPIVQVQVGYIKKSDLVGEDPNNPAEWYLRNTIIDTRRTNTFAFPGAQDNLKRVRFDIQQNYLVVRRSYEMVSGSDGKGATTIGADGKPMTVNDGVIVAMYPIKKHFDIKYDYDTTTGEEHNILTENDTDRVWYQRDYIRVDWSQNLVDDPDFEELWFPKVFGEVNLEPVQYYETDPNSPNAPVMDTPHGYFDITTKMIAQTENYVFGDPKHPDFQIPACLLVNLFTGSDTFDCNDQEFVIRSSFMKVVDHDYEAAETTGDKYTMFGTFTRTRYGYDRGYGVTDQNFHQYMSRHNVWQKSHMDNACGGPNADRAAEDAKCNAISAGSVCDETANKCTLAYEDRKIRTIPYYVDQTMPADLNDANQALVNEWNDAMKVAVSTAREVECRDTRGGDAGSCHSTFFNDDGSPKTEAQVVVMCHNPVADGDDAACSDGKPIDANGQVRARQGDLRFNLIGWIDGDVQGPLGYGPDGADPLTGEVVQATAYIYGAALDYYAAQVRDIVAMANGDLAPDAFTNGKAATDNLGSYKPNAKTADPTLFQRYADYLQGKLDRRYDGAMTDDEIASRLAGINASETVAKIGAAGAIDSSASAGARLQTVNALMANAGAVGVEGFGGASEAQAKLDGYAARLAGTPTEHALIDDPQYVLANALATTGDPNAMAAAISPFGVGGALQISAKRDALYSHLEAAGQCVFGADEFNAPNVQGLANRLRGLYDFTDSIPAECKQPNDPSDPAQFAEAARLCRQDKVFHWLRTTIYKAVTEHEVGHTMSLRHNFQGSWDSINYHPNYWRLRTNNGANTNKICTTARKATDPDNCMGPRWLDPMTDDEVGKAGQPGIDEFAYSSIMDYGYDFNSDLHGIGSYDKAAMKFVYGGVVETFDPSVSAQNQDKLSPINASPITEQWMVKSADGKTTEPIHYTKLAGMMNLFDPSRCTDVDPSSPQAADAVDGQVCTGPAKGNAFVRDMQSGEVVPGVYAAYYKAKDGSIRWPYRFGSDEYSSYPQGLRFDAGADIYEASTQLLNLYEYRYVLDFYRRSRRGWAPWLSFGSRLWGRYFSRFHSLGWLTALRVSQASAMYPDKTPDTNPALNSDDWGRGYALASTVLFEGLERSALRPQPGGYAAKQADPDATKALFEVPDFPTGTEAWNVGVLDGRYVDEVYDNDVGGSFNYLNYLQRMGTYAEKPIAAIALNALWPEEHVVTRDTYLDGRNVLLNFRSILPDAYDRLYAGMLGEDWDTVAPYVNANTAKKNPGKLVDAVTYTPLWQKDISRPANATLIDPLVGYKMQTSSIVLGLYFGTGNGSMALPNSMRIWAEGGPEGIVVPDAEKVRLYEPESGITWAAHRLGTDLIDGKTVEKGIGARMLVHANWLLAAAYKVKTDSDGLPIYDTDGKVVWQDGVAPGTIVDEASRDRFRKFMGVINVERTAIWDFGFGPL